MINKFTAFTGKIKQKIKLKVLLDNKKFTVPFSIVVAVVLWLSIMINQNPVREQVFTDVDATISLENTVLGEMGLGIINDISAQKFTVRISGPNYIVSSLRADDFVISADVTQVNSAGTYKLALNGSRNSYKSGYTFSSISPSEIEVTFDYIDTKEYPVTPKIIGAVAGEGLVAETPVINGLEDGIITIKGPRQIMDKIDSVVAFAEVNSTLTSTKTYNADIIVYDADGGELDMTNLVMEKTVKVSVPISKKVKLPVKAAFNNLPSGLSAEDVNFSIDHSTVTVIGTPEVVDKMTEVSLSPVDFTSVSTTANQFEVSAVLPYGVRLLDNIEFFTVSVNTSGYSEKTFTIPSSAVKYSGLESSLSARVSGSIKNVKICGAKDEINDINVSDLYAEAELSDIKAGEYTVSVTIKSDKYSKVWQVGQYSVAVTVK